MILMAMDSNQEFQPLRIFGSKSNQTLRECYRIMNSSSLVVENTEQ